MLQAYPNPGKQERGSLRGLILGRTQARCAAQIDSTGPFHASCREVTTFPTYANLWAAARYLQHYARHRKCHMLPNGVTHSDTCQQDRATPELHLPPVETFRYAEQAYLQ